MEIVGASRIKDGVETVEFFVRCPEHNWYYTGKPPLTTGCRECWLVHFYGELAQKKDFKGEVEQLEQVIQHMAEADDKGEFDYIPKYDIEIQHEN